MYFDKKEQFNRIKKQMHEQKSAVPLWGKSVLETNPKPPSYLQNSVDKLYCQSGKRSAAIDDEDVWNWPKLNEAKLTLVNGVYE